MFSTVKHFTQTHASVEGGTSGAEELADLDKRGRLGERSGSVHRLMCPTRIWLGSDRWAGCLRVLILQTERRQEVNLQLAVRIRHKHVNQTAHSFSWKLRDCFVVPSAETRFELHVQSNSHRQERKTPSFGTVGPVFTAWKWGSTCDSAWEALIGSCEQLTAASADSVWFSRWCLVHLRLKDLHADLLNMS